MRQCAVSKLFTVPSPEAVWVPFKRSDSEWSRKVSLPDTGANLEPYKLWIFGPASSWRRLKASHEDEEWSLHMPIIL
uniref:Uncharacterized protein n=1 Tax=Globodera pallida TaxID=36090 RepID=A0A183CGX5_GLOPA